MTTKHKNEISLAYDMPAPEEVTQDEMEKARIEAREIRCRLDEQTKNMETIDDLLHVRIV